MAEAKAEAIRLGLQQGLVRRLFIAPLLEQRTRLYGIVFALGFLALSEGLFLLMVKGFIKALFGTGQVQSVALGELVPAKTATWWPALAAMRVETAVLVVAVPVIILLAGWCKALASYLYQLNQQALALYLARSYREQLFTTLVHLPYVAITKRQAGAWMSLIMNDVMLLQSRFTDIMTGLLKDTVATLSCFIVLALIHWPSALVLMALSPFVAFGMGRTGKRIARYAEIYQRELGGMAAAVLDMRARFDFIRAQQGERREEQRFALRNHGYFEMIRRSILVRSAFAPVLEFAGFAVFAASIYAIGHGYWGDFSPDLMLQFFVALGLLLRPLREMGEQIARFHETRGTLLDSLGVFAQLAAAIPPAPTARPLSVSGGLEPVRPPEGHAPLLVIQSMTAGMAGTPRFHAMDLALLPGRTIVIIGPSGAGKSTLLKTLAGLVEPLQWQATLPWRAATNLMSMVSQEPFLFDDTIAGNLVYGLGAGMQPPPAALWEALATVNIDAEIRALPEGLNTRLRAIGSNVSGGQLQRLVIARALLRQRPVLLLDEATSAVDVRSEKDITLRLIAACRSSGQAVVAVTHRLTWLEAFAEVWFVEGGEVALRGPHQQLLAQPRYRAYCEAAGERRDD